MKATGIVRRADELGRIVLPIELRRKLDIELHDPLEIFVDGETIILRKYQQTCIFCGVAENLTSFKGKNICASCLQNLDEMQTSTVLDKSIPAESFCPAQG